MLIISMLTISILHPLMMVMLLVLLVVLISMQSSFINLSSWFPYSFILMMIGGLLILFIYMASMSPNEKLLSPQKYMIFMLIPMIIFINLFPSSQKMMYNLPLINMIPNNPSIMIFSIIYLFNFLFMLTMVVNLKKGPLRST